ncbi:hypothetical protein JR316_0005635 [Psilocybe cubensis]|uniref:Uncharacterized protein n=2 Tax=Psilocybe cubensis TaxID=181762 RepID=A0ACB8H1P7_PSICU|nr:hypothetical protein JR316_0005635 [Psilocybe cubensis]KAH9481115.1 hypothetical protein JR316_0005635 [Psilocybe cubensis]
MPSQRTKSTRRSKKNTLYKGDADAAEAITYQSHTRKTRTGREVTELVKVPLTGPQIYRRKDTAHLQGGQLFEGYQPEPESLGFDSNSDEENVDPTAAKKTQRHYINQFVERVDSLLEAFMSREAPTQSATPLCTHCEGGAKAAWRCWDCSLPENLCRKCMRQTHRTNPMHRIEQWIGTHFQKAELWEVGGYILIPHCTNTPMCSGLKFQAEFLEGIKEPIDKTEQTQLQAMDMGRAPIQHEHLDHIDAHDAEMDEAEDPPPHPDDVYGISDVDFKEYLDRIREEALRGTTEVVEDGNDDAEVRKADADITSMASFYPQHVPVADALNNSLSNLELKASTYQFYNLIRRLTNPISPSLVANLYNKFRRMTRLWRWMKKLKWAGFAGHNGRSALDVKKGELAVFCPACPQPGINLDENWKDDKNRWVYKRIFVADGNFKANHVCTEKPSQDVWLSEGSGMIPKRTEYTEFLKSAIEALTGAPCENTFRAIQNLLLSSSSCDITGVVGIACARHSCYAPNALVDLFKGEQQKNVDFALLAALKSTGVDPDQGAMVIYDIIYQYIIYLLKRIGHHLPPGLKIDRAIGMFHVHAHKDQCFFRYAPTFIPGAACVCSEILEPLWSDLNAVSPAARTATLAHRAELLDKHACDSNHKKMLGITQYLCRRHVESKKRRDDLREVFSNLTKSADPETIQLWTKQIEEAESKRLTDPSVMDIYTAKWPGSNPVSIDEVGPVSPLTSLESWIQFALVVEEKQAAGVVQTSTKSIGLLEQLFIDWEDEEDVLAPGTTPIIHEEIDKQPLCLPSNGTAPMSYAPCELKARISQARGHLNQIRELIAERSFTYSDIVRKGPRKGVRTRGRTVANELRDRISLHALPDADPNSIGEDADPATVLEFKRVHWLRARAHYQRWQEEATLVRYEMQWTVAYFIHKRNTWKQAISEDPNLTGEARAYAYRKIEMWNYLALLSDQSFRRINSNYTPMESMA